MPLDSAPAVSVVMPAHNAVRFIGAAIESVLAQTHADWELIVVDDASTDGTSNRARAYAERDARVRYISTTHNVGVAGARNLGLEMARGRYIAFLDSDDLWFPRKLELQVEFLDSSQGSVSYGNYVRIDEQGNVIGNVNAPARVDYRAMLRSNFIGNLTGIYRRAPLAALRFDAVGHEDYLFWLNAVRLTGPAAAPPTEAPLAAYRVGPTSISANKFRAMKWQWDIYRKHLGLPLPDSLCLFPQYIFFALKKRRL